MMAPIPEEGAPPAADIEVPTANPLQPNAETTYVSLVPGIPADANSVFSIRNGYDDVQPEAAKKIHRLSTRVLQLAVVNAVVIVTIRVVYIALWAMEGRDVLVAEYSVYIFFSLVILYLGVQGVRKKNPPCCGGCGCGYLTTFYAIYIVFAAVSALTVLISLIFLVAPRRPLTLRASSRHRWRGGGRGFASTARRNAIDATCPARAGLRRLRRQPRLLHIVRGHGELHAAVVR